MEPLLLGQGVSTDVHVFSPLFSGCMVVSILVYGCGCKSHATQGQDSLLVAMKQMPMPKWVRVEVSQRLRHIGTVQRLKRGGMDTGGCRGIEAW